MIFTPQNFEWIFFGCISLLFKTIRDFVTLLLKSSLAAKFRLREKKKTISKIRSFIRYGFYSW